MKTLTKLELVDKPAVKAAFLSFRMTPAFVGSCVSGDTQRLCGDAAEFGRIES